MYTTCYKGKWVCVCAIKDLKTIASFTEEYQLCATVKVIFTKTLKWFKLLYGKEVMQGNIMTNLIHGSIKNNFAL